MNATLLQLNWTIPNFSHYTRKNEYVLSPNFMPSEQFRLSLRLYPNGFSEADKGVIIFLHLADCGDFKEINVHYKFSVLDSYGVKFCVKEIKGQFVRECQFGFPEYVRRNYLMDPANRLLADDKLSIYCELKISTDPIGFATFNDKHKLVQDLTKLLNNGKFRDVTFIFHTSNYQTQELMAHKDILAARSVVFAAMFEHETNREAMENKVDITDVDLETFQELLRFVYTGKVNSLELLADRLLAASDKYDISDLKMECEDFLCTKMNPETAGNLLLLADMYNCPKLKSTVTSFFHNNAAKIKKTKACDQLVQSRPDLFKELYFNLASKKQDSSGDT